MKSEQRIVEDFWSTVDCSASEKNYYAFPPIRAHSCNLIFGESDASRRDWVEYWTVEKYLKDQVPFESALSICCGFGAIERRLSRLGVAKRITGTDIAPGAIAKAREKAEAEGLDNVEYFVSDLNTEELGEGVYGLIWANGALHHIKDLERVLPMLYRALKPGGYLVSNEYVGPAYKQVDKRQEEIINAVKHLIPPKLRGDVFKPADGSLKARLRAFLKRIWYNGIPPRGVYERIWRPYPVRFFKSHDPSECVNSNNIIPVLKETFDEVDVRHFGGSVLCYLLTADFYDNFEFGNEEHERLLQMLFDIEDALIETGELESDNAHIICRKAGPQQCGRERQCI